MAVTYKKTLEFFHKTPQTKAKKTHTSANANAGLPIVNTYLLFVCYRVSYLIYIRLFYLFEDTNFT